MPRPFHCHECDKPTMNKSGICDSCESEIYAQGLRSLMEDDKEKGIDRFFEGTLVPREKIESDS